MNMPDRTKDNRWLILVIVATAQLMVVLDATIVNIALPSAQHDLGFADSDRQWIVTSYALAFGSLLLLGGRIGDIFGRKWAFIGGLAGFAVASAVGGAASSFGVLVTARAAQGVFGALLAPAALGTLVSTFTDPKDRGKAFGIFGSVAGGGSAVGLVLGGILTEDLSWRWCLYVNLAFAIVAGIGAAIYITNVKPPVRPKLDVVGTVLASTALFGLVFGFSQAETKGWGDATTITSLVAGGVLLVSFVFSQTKVPNPLLPLRVVTDRARASAYLAVMFAAISIFGVFLFVTYFLQGTLGFSPIQSGFAFLPMTAGILFSSNTSTLVTVPRFGPRPIITTGMTLGAIAMLWFTQLDVHSTYASGILPPLVIMGLGFGMIIAPAINAATAGVNPADAGVASAMVNTMQQVGGSVGTSLLSTIVASATTGYLHSHPGQVPDATTHGFSVAFACAAGLFAFGAIVTGSLMPTKAGLAKLRGTVPESVPTELALEDALQL